jgi:hypothetical protein
MQIGNLVTELKQSIPVIHWKYLMANMYGLLNERYEDDLIKYKNTLFILENYSKCGIKLPKSICTLNIKLEYQTLCSEPKCVYE